MLDVGFRLGLPLRIGVAGKEPAISVREQSRHVRFLDGPHLGEQANDPRADIVIGERRPDRLRGST